MTIHGLLDNYAECFAMVLFVIGFMNLLLQHNLIKKIIGFNIMDSSIFLFLAVKGYVEGKAAPIITEGVTNSDLYVNPIPAGLVLTGIVVSVSVSAVMLSLTIRLYGKYHSLDIDVIMKAVEKEGV